LTHLGKLLKLQTSSPPSERTTEIVDISWISVQSDAVISQRNLAMHPAQGRVILSVEQPF
jgi:hypothetical protein